jgi:hypothetical protein
MVVDRERDACPTSDAERTTRRRLSRLRARSSSGNRPFLAASKVIEATPDFGVLC